MINENIAKKENEDSRVELFEGRERQVNQYQLISQVGTGAFSEVFVCKDVYRQKTFAMKIFSRSYLKRKRQFLQFKHKMKVQTAMDDVDREIALMKKIDHKNVVHFYEFIDDPKGDHLYLILEYCTLGQILYWSSENSRYLKDRKLDTNRGFRGFSALEQSRALNVLKDICLGLRDLKPENILLDAFGTAKIADFGIAHNLSQEDNELINPSSGTPFFMGPERVGREDQDPFPESASDYWSLGICFFSFLFSYLPFFPGNPSYFSQQVFLKSSNEQKTQNEDEEYGSEGSFDADDPANLDSMYSLVLFQELDFDHLSHIKSNATEEGDEQLHDGTTTLLQGLLRKDPNKRFTAVKCLETLGFTKEEIVKHDEDAPSSRFLQPTEAELETAISVRMDFFTVVKLKMFVRNWKAKAEAARTEKVKISNAEKEVIASSATSRNTNKKSSCCSIS
eukprot:maker-scaffold_9-snap-gene-11.11-mRNA-1 protein AED:0.05 eAED:0.07 QI:0/0.66/0.75/1/1/1/4/525/450